MLLILASALLMMFDHKQHRLHLLRAGLSVVIAPVQYTVDLPVRIGEWADRRFSSRRTLNEKIQTLQNDSLRLRARLMKFADLEAENQRLRELFLSSRRVADEVIIAELYKVNLDPYKHLVRLNKGSTEGVYVDQPVLDAHGVMGQIVEVNPVFSTARLITDPNHVIQVHVNRNGLRTLAVGTGDRHALDLPDLPSHADIQAGDLLVTSGLAGVYPPGYPVAVVQEVKRKTGKAFAEIIAIPKAHMDRSRNVMLVQTQGRGATTRAELENSADQQP